MITSTLFKVFQRFSPPEVRELSKFVRSPFFNQREDVVNLFDYLAHDQEEPSKLEAFQVVYPGTEYDDKQMRLIMHFLLNTFKEYIAYSELTKDKINKKVHLSKGLRKKGLNKLFQREVKKLQNNQDRQNAQSHYYNFQLALEEYHLEYRDRRTGKADLSALTHELTSYYLAEMYRQACTLLSHQNISTQNYDLSLVDSLAIFSDQSAFQDAPAISVYRCAYETLRRSEQSSSFEQLKSLLDQYRHHFPPSEIRDLYLLTINYCIRQLNKGEKPFIRVAFELYRSGLNNKVLLEDGQLSKFTYNNVLMLALALEEWTWANKFLETYRTFLPTAEEENIYGYNLSIYYFRKKEYAKAMELLREVTFEDVQYDLNARRMLLRIYYELNELDALDSLLDSFRIFIRRRKKLGYHKENYLNLISFMKRLMRIPPGNKEALKTLRRKVNATEGIAEKKWLLEQLGPPN